MRVMQTLPRRGEKGYSLIEALVVVALIGLLSVIAVPNFIQMYRSSKLRSSLRNFTSDLRWARQRAVSETIVVICSFPPPGTASNQYRFYRSRLDMNGAVDTTALATLNDQAGQAQYGILNQDVYFASVTSFSDTVDTTGLNAADEDYIDIVFLTNGTLRATGTPQVQMRTSVPVPIPAYNVNFSVAGGLKAEKP